MANTNFFIGKSCCLIDFNPRILGKVFPRFLNVVYMLRWGPFMRGTPSGLSQPLCERKGNFKCNERYLELEG